MRQDDLYDEVVSTFGGALERLARSYEGDADRRRDLLQEIHLALWRSLAGFENRCSLRTWVYRVAQNVAASHVLRSRRSAQHRLLSLDEVHDLPSVHDGAAAVDRQVALERLYRLIHNLGTIDREVILLYLEGLDAASIGEITGIAPGHVATKIHRIKKLLRQLTEGGRHDV